MDLMESRVWRDFVEQLHSTLQTMQEDQFLVIALKGSNRFVQFAHYGDHGLRAEVSSNASLNITDRLSHSEIEKLLDLGWSEPTNSPARSTPQDDPDGSLGNTPIFS